MHYTVKCQLSRWTLQTWPKEDPEKLTESPYRCRSWRHTGECAEWRARNDYARIVAGMATRDYWCHVVLTYHNWQGRDVQVLWRQSLGNWARLRKRIGRIYGEYKYIQTWEVTRKGCPHCHMAVSCQRMHELCERIPQGLDKPARDAIGQHNFVTVMGEHAQACGFGERGYIEAIWGQEGFVRYLEKLKRELTMAASKSQLPLEAPRHFRRIRASVRLIPPPHKDERITGHLVDEAGEIVTKRKAVTS